ncbi:unnamed protein product, partial [Laminaria digitata]
GGWGYYRITWYSIPGSKLLLYVILEHDMRYVFVRCRRLALTTADVELTMCALSPDVAFVALVELPKKAILQRGNSRKQGTRGGIFFFLFWRMYVTLRVHGTTVVLENCFAGCLLLL